MITKTPYIICVSSQKGGVGKSTISMLLSIGLLRYFPDLKVLDCDEPQYSLYRYMQNRQDSLNESSLYQELQNILINTEYKNLEGLLKYMQCQTIASLIKSNKLPKGLIPEKIIKSPNFREIVFTPQCIKCKNILLEINNYDGSLCIIDLPPGDKEISDIVHEISDTIITVVGDSFMDVVTVTEPKNCFPGYYSEKLWDAKKIYLQKNGKSQNWMLILNRISQYKTKNTLHIKKVLNNFAQQSGIKEIYAIKERVIYKEGFLKGLTPLDNVITSTSNTAAKQEIKNILDSIQQILTNV